MARALRAMLAITTFLAVAGAATAQGTITVPAELNSGKDITVQYSNAGMVKQTVTITIDNGNPDDPETTTVEIQLDENGSGSKTWTVPTSWDSALFNAPQATEVARMIG